MGQHNNNVKDLSGIAMAFGPFRFLPRKRLLLNENKEVRLGSRAFDILGILLIRAGEVVPATDIISHVWPGTLPESNALRVHIASLRKALGDVRGRSELITNVLGQGYRFGAPVTQLTDDNRELVTDRPHDVPFRANRVVGRENDVASVTSLLAAGSLVTIVGPCGIGKTTLAHVISDRAMKSGLRTYFVDLAPLSDPASVVSTIAMTLGLPARSNKSSEIAAFLSRQRALLVLDNCEHVLTEIADLGDELRDASPNIRILTTSREPLQRHGEHVYQLEPLALPPSAKSLAATDALTFSAIELFVDRASSVVHSFDVSNKNVQAVVEICRRLDGIPLAIEFAAGQVEMFGLGEVARGLDRALETLSGTKRTAVKRHRTLGEALDWSYRLLSPTERIVLHRLSIFAGKFDLPSAIAVSTCPEIGSEQVAANVAGLAKKSMISIDSKDSRFRLLETTRAYAGAKLKEAGELRQVAKLHAIYCCRLSIAEENNWEERAADAWLAERGTFIDDIRSALAWAFSADGDAGLGVELAAISAPLWFRLSLLDEYIGWAERGLATLSNGPNPGKRQQLQLVAALGHALLHTKGPVPRMAEAFEKTLALSNELGIADHRSRAYWGLCSQKLISGDYAGALACAEEFFELHRNSADLASRLMMKRMNAIALHNLGETPLARRLLEEVLAQPAETARCAIDSAFYVDDRVAAMAFLGTTLWVEGLPTRAIQAAQASVEDALCIEHMPSLCYALAISACPISLWMGNDEQAEEFAELLLERSQEHHLEFWNLWGKSYATALAQRKGAALGLRDAPHLYLRAGRAGPLRETIATVCPGISDMGLYREAELQSPWCRPELLRIRAEQLRLDPTIAIERPESTLLIAQKLARRQGALSWELRAAISLAGLRKENRRQDAREVIADVLNRFVDPYPTTDMRTAQRLLQELR
jgi:predicted ATPase/DNA-binding winged helix-turn-helix (wHTH) protein